MGKVDDETLALLRDQFAALDADGSGALDEDDIKLLTQACEEQEAAAAAAASTAVSDRKSASNDAKSPR